MTTEMLAEYGRAAVRLSEEEPRSERDQIVAGASFNGSEYVQILYLGRLISIVEEKVTSAAVVAGSKGYRLETFEPFEVFHANGVGWDPLLFFDRLLRKPVVPSYPKFHPDLR